MRPGDDRVFVTERRRNRSSPFDADGTNPFTVLDISSLVTSNGEQGLLGLAFHPTEQLAYVDYTGTDGGNTHIDEFAVLDNGTLDPSTRRAVLEIDQPYANHNGGQLMFGPDGYLYIGMGDGGSAGDPERRALDTGQLLGKILRIDPRAFGGQPYTVPADNPFVGVAGARPEIWSFGLRNPWRFSFDPQTNDLWIADVGQDQWEEVDVAWADEGGGRGTNFGWSAFEGSTGSTRTSRRRAPSARSTSTRTPTPAARSAAGPATEGRRSPRSTAGTSTPTTAPARCAPSRSTVAQPGGTWCSASWPAVSSVAAGPDGELYVTSVDDYTLNRIEPA